MEKSYRLCGTSDAGENANCSRLQLLDLSGGTCAKSRYVGVRADAARMYSSGNRKFRAKGKE